MSGTATLTPARPLRRAVNWLADMPDRQFRWALLALYVAHLVSGLMVHAMWLDEVQAWLLVRDSATLSELARNLRYEGHPLGWYLLLWPLKYVGTRPELAQVAQGACALAVASLLIWRAPLGRLELALALLSYPLLFEYAVKSRSYALGCVVLFLFCDAFTRRRSPLLLAALVALLWNVHALFGLVGFGCLAAVLVQRAVEGGWRTMLTPTDVGPIAIVLIGVATAALVARPPPDSGFAVPWRLDLEYRHVVDTARTFGALVFGRIGYDRVASFQSLIGMGVVAVIGFRWRRAPAAAAFLAVAGGFMLAFFHVKYGPLPWHRSLAIVLVLATIWLARGVRGPGGPALLPRWLLALVLAAQAVAGLRAAVTDRLHPYSGGRAAAEALLAAGLDKAPLVAIHSFAGPSVVAYLQIPSVFAWTPQRDESFMIFDDKRIGPLDDKSAVEVVLKRPDAIVLDCTPYELNTASPDPLLTVWGIFSGEMESCAIYRLAQPAKAAP